MRSYRSILAVILAMVTTFLVSCGNPKALTPPSYSTEQIEQIQKLTTIVTALRDKMPILEDKIQNQNWTDVSTYIHGPLGELRRSTSYVTRELLPQEQKQATAVTKDLFNRIQNIDLASTKGNYQLAIQSYQAALKDLDEFLQLVPQRSDSGVSG
jgi:photosystem II protein PsbQ